MKEVAFVTSNVGKVRSLQAALDSQKYKVVQYSLKIPEIQADATLEISLDKAKSAYESLLGEIKFLNYCSYRII